MAINETNILGGKAIILTNDFDIWQYRCWISAEKKYIRESLKTKDKELAIELAEKKTIEYMYRVERGDKLFGVCLEEAVDKFIEWKSRFVGLGAKRGIVKGRLNTIITHLNHFKNYVGPKTKIHQIPKSILRSNIVNEVETSYVEFRKEYRISDSSIDNEISTFGMFYRYISDELDLTNVRTLAKCETNKVTGIDNARIRRQTFTIDEYKSFTYAMLSYVAKKKQQLADDEYFDRLLAKQYFLFAANSGMRSGELRQLKWERVALELHKRNGHNSEDILLAKVEVDAQTSKVRIGRTFKCVGEHLQNWANLSKHKTGYIFSRDGKTEMPRKLFNMHFRKIMSFANIEKDRKKALVPYSLRHYFITKQIQEDLSFGDTAIHCGTSVGQIERTYLHLNDTIMNKTALNRFRSDRVNTNYVSVKKLAI